MLFLLRPTLPGARNRLRKKRQQGILSLILDVPILPLQMPQKLQGQEEPQKGQMDQGLQKNPW